MHLFFVLFLLFANAGTIDGTALPVSLTDNSTATATPAPEPTASISLAPQGSNKSLEMEGVLEGLATTIIVFIAISFFFCFFCGGRSTANDEDTTAVERTLEDILSLPLLWVWVPLTVLLRTMGKGVTAITALLSMVLSFIMMVIGLKDGNGVALGLALLCFCLFAGIVVLGQRQTDPAMYFEFPLGLSVTYVFLMTALFVIAAPVEHFVESEDNRAMIMLIVIGGWTGIGALYCFHLDEKRAIAAAAERERLHGEERRREEKEEANKPWYKKLSFFN